MTEIWKPINGYKGYYAVSNFGRIKSLKRLVKKWDGLKTIPEKFKVEDYSSGYGRVKLFKNGEYSCLLIHRVVLLAFTKQPSKKHEVNHKNGIKSDNHLSNLEWVTKSENLLHAHRTGLKKSLRGEDAWQSKLNQRQVDEIRTRSKQGEKTVSIAKDYPVNYQAVTKIIRNERWVQ